LKKITAILLLGVLLINAIGYRFILAYMENKAHQQMVTRLDNNQYNESELIELSAPLNLPYFTNWQSFERCDGQITINGIAYNYVARKYQNNVMIYKCIPNRAKQNVITAKKQIDQLAFGGLATEKPQKDNYPLGQYFKDLGDYDDVCNRYQHPLFSTIAKKRYPSFAQAICSGNASPQLQPPDISSLV
jgi:hypothetical protein